MAIGQPAISAADAARAYAQDYSGVANLFQNLQEQQYRRQLLEDQRRQQRELQQAEMLRENVSPLMQVTGTPFDAYASKRTQEILKGYNDFMRKNPNANYLAQQQYFLQNTGALKNELETAKLLNKQINDYAAQIEKEYPTLDRTKVLEAMRKAAWYDDRGQLKTPDVNSIASFVSRLGDINEYRKYVNPEALTSTVVKNLDERFPEQGTNIPVEGTPYYWDARLRAYEQLNPKTGDRYIPTENYKVGDTELPIMPEYLYRRFATDRNFQAATLNKLDDIYEVAPNIKSLPADVQQRLAANLVISDLGNRMSKQTPVKKVSEEAKWDLQLQKEARNARHQKMMESIASENLRLRKAGKEQDNLAKQFINILNNDPETIKRSHITTIQPASFTATGIPQNTQPRAAIEMTSLVPGGMVKANDGTNDRLKIYKDLDETGNLFVQRFTPKPNKDDARRTDWVPAGWKEYSKSEAINFINSISAQLSKRPVQYSTDVDNYYQLFTSEED